MHDHALNISTFHQSSDVMHSLKRALLCACSLPFCSLPSVPQPSPPFYFVSLPLLERLQLADGSDSTAPSATSYHKLSLEVMKRLSGPVPRRPSSHAAEGGSNPGSASAKGQVTSLPAPHRQPSTAAAKGRLTPSQPPEELLAAGTAEGKSPPSQPAEGQLSAAVTKRRISASVVFSKGSQTNGHRRAGPGHSTGPSSSSALVTSIAQAADLTQPKAHTMHNALAGRKACSNGHSRTTHKVNLSGKSAAESQTRTADPSDAVSTANPAVLTAAAAVKNHATATMSAAASQNASASMASTAGHKAHDGTLPAQSTPGRQQTTFSFADVEEDLMEAGSGQAAVLHSEGSFTHKIMQQMIYTGSHEDQNHLFLEVCRSLQVLASKMF